VKTRSQAGGDNPGPKLEVTDAKAAVFTHAASSPAAGLRAGALAERTLHRRAVEAALWGMPLVGFASMRSAYFRSAGAEYLDMVYWSNPELWSKQTPAPHQSAAAVLFANLRGGPLILEVPPLHDLVSVTLFDAWSAPLPRPGEEGDENARGGRYVLLPPDRAAAVPSGYTPLRAPTHDVGCSVRVLPESASARDQVKASVLAKRLRIRPLLMSAATPPSRFIDMTGRLFDGALPTGVAFFATLAQMVGEVPPRQQDAGMIGLLGTLGVRKGVRFQPSPELSEILEGATVEASASFAEARRSSGQPYWPGRRWRSSAQVEAADRGTAPAPDALATDGSLGNGALDVASHETAIFTLHTGEDADGNALEGSFTYRLHVPAGVPTRRFWSAAAYDEETSAFIRGAPSVAVSSRDRGLSVNRDGTADVYFAPERPEGIVNWISTAAGRRFFVVFRNHAPNRGALGHPSRWVMSDLVRAWPPAESGRARAG
jgi:hypothetical protein